VTVKEKN